MGECNSMVQIKVKKFIRARYIPQEDENDNKHLLVRVEMVVKWQPLLQQPQVPCPGHIPD